MLHILVTGGTFDKEYNELTGALYFNQTHVQEMLAKGRSRLDLSIETLFMKDSLEFTNAEREFILNACEKSPANRLLITHGTDTMTQTADYLSGKLPYKTIVLTGAMIPYKFGSSDGMFNLGSALAFAQILSSGVYISMNGKLFEAGKVRKNLDKGEFEAIN